MKIIRVKTISFRINEYDAIRDEPEKLIRIELQHKIGYNAELNFINLTIRAYTFYDEESLRDKILTDIEVENLFSIENLPKYYSNGADTLPATVWTTLVSISISHTRALLAEKIAGTLFSDTIIPIVNPVEVAQAFLPHKFTLPAE